MVSITLLWAFDLQKVPRGLKKATGIVFTPGNPVIN